MSALADPMERVTQMIAASAEGLRSDILQIVAKADAKFTEDEAKIGRIVFGAEKLFSEADAKFNEVRDKITAMTAAEVTQNAHVQRLQDDVKDEVTNMTNVFDKFSSEVKAEIIKLSVMTADHETTKLRMTAELTETHAFMSKVTEYLSHSGGQADGTRNIAMGLVSSHTEIHKLITELQNDVKKANVKIQEMESAPRGTENGTRTHNSGKPIMEYKGILDMKNMNQEGYKEWKDKFHNKMEQARPGITKVLEHIERNCKIEITPEMFEIDCALSDPTQKWDTVGRELMSVLIDKTEGEARSKIKSVKASRDGINAYRVMHEWFSRVSGLGLSERRRRVMLPSPPGKEDQVVPAIEKWERDMRELEEMDEEEGLSDKMKIVAIQNLVVGHMKDVVRRKDWDDYDTLRSYIMSWAMRLRAERNTESMTKEGEMDISNVYNGTSETSRRGEDVTDEWWVTDQEQSLIHI